MDKVKMAGVILLCVGMLCGCGKVNGGMDVIGAETEKLTEELTQQSSASQAVDEQSSGTQPSEIQSSDSQAALEDNDKSLEEYKSVVVENPSWDYYIAEETESNTIPHPMGLSEQKENQITDTEEWFKQNGLEMPAQSADEIYSCEIAGDGTLLIVSKEGIPVAELDFSDYQYAKDENRAQNSFVEETLRYAIVEDAVLYVSTFHYTYAASEPLNAYITAISLEDYSVLWKTAPLTCNSLNFEIVGDVIFCGYGFTDEADYLYQLDKKTGKELASMELKSMAEYIVYKEANLYVRTYNTDYVYGFIQ